MNINEYFERAYFDYRLSEMAKSYLAPQGWFHSIAASSPIDAQGPVPWITFPAREMLKRIIRPEFKVLEYGCGSSTTWWSKVVAQVVSVDHDSAWIQKIRPALPVNAVIVHHGLNAAVDDAFVPVLREFDNNKYDLPVSGSLAHDIEHGFACREFSAYACEILKYPSGYFDVVVVDGMARTLTAWLAARQVRDSGIILFDNSDRWQYNTAFQLLSDSGFAKLDFWGPGPARTVPWCTSLFVKNINVLKANPLLPRGQASDLHW